MAFDADIRHWRSVDAFAEYLRLLTPPAWPRGSTIHNTYRPLESQWAGMASMQSMMAVYIAKGWSAGPNLYLCAGAPNPANDGIWQMTPVTHQGVHAGECNTSRWGVEVVGDFQARGWSFAQRALILDTLAALHGWAKLGGNVVGHRDCMAGRTCPGDKAYAALPQLRADLGVRLASKPASTPPTPAWAELWGPIALPDATSWQWQIPQAWKANHLRLGKCISAALYDDARGIVVQCFEGGVVRQRQGGQVEVCFR